MGKYAQTHGWLTRQAELLLSCQVSFLFSVYPAVKAELSFPDKGSVIAY